MVHGQHSQGLLCWQVQVHLDIKVQYLRGEQCACSGMGGVCTSTDAHLVLRYKENSHKHGHNCALGVQCDKANSHKHGHKCALGVQCGKANSQKLSKLAADKKNH